MQHRPKLVKALAQMASAVWDKESEVDLGFKRLVAYMASRTHGCNYSMAHAAEAAHRVGMTDDKLEAVAEYRTSPLFTEAERVALDFAVAAASQPNAVTDALFERMKQHWTDAQIVEIAAAVALNGFLNRWSDTLAVPLEPEPTAFGEKHLKSHGWHVGKHK
jgi:alkylhydroperoxidase family enzyme